MKLDMVIEIPIGSKLKLEFDEEFKKMRYKRELLFPMPINYGAILNARGQDSDLTDAILLAPPLISDCVVAVKPIGLLHVIDGGEIDDKVLCVLAYKPEYNKFKQVPKSILNELEHYFTVYKQLDSKKNQVKGWRGLDYTKKIIKKDTTNL